MKKDFGEKIRILRTMKGYSQQGLARTIGIKQENISYLESNKGKKQLSPDLLQKFADAFKMPLSSFEDYLRADLYPPPAAGGGDIYSTLENLLIMQKELNEQLQKLNELFSSKY